MHPNELIRRFDELSQAITVGSTATLRAIYFLQQRMEQRMDGLEQRIDGLENRVEQHIYGLEHRVEQRIDGMDNQRNSSQE